MTMHKNIRKDAQAILFDLILGIISAILSLIGLFLVATKTRLKRPNIFAVSLTFWIGYLIFSIAMIGLGIHSKIKEIHKKLLDYFNKEKGYRIPFKEFINTNIKDDKKAKEEKIVSFYSLLHLDNKEKVWLEQDEHFG